MGDEGCGSAAKLVDKLVNPQSSIFKCPFQHAVLDGG